MKAHPCYTKVPPQSVAQNPCGIDAPHQLHRATPQQAQKHLEQVLAKYPWLRSKAAGILESMRTEMNLQLSLAEPRNFGGRWYSVQLMRAYMHTHSTQAVRQRIEQLYEVML